MLLSFLTPDAFQRVRDVLRVGLDEAALPALTIQDPLYYGRAAAEVLAVYPGAESATGTTAQHLRNAVVLLTAAYLAESIALPQSEQFGHYRYQLSPENWAARAAELRAQAEALLALVTGETEADAVPCLFTVAPGCRGR
jgi:hypothetical protein